MRAFWTAWQLLTRLPAPGVPFDAEIAGRSVPYYPLIGLVIGALMALLHVALAHADAQLQAALVLAAWVLVTGGLHLDGLADSADAWAGSHGDRERALAIMKDSRSGPAGVMMVALVLLVKFAALAVLLRTAPWSALLVAPLLGRVAVVLLFLTTAYVRPNGLGAPHAARLSRPAAWLSLALSAAAVAACLRWTAPWILGAALLAVLGLRQMMRQRLGGATGDTLGATCELIEAVALVAIALTPGMPSA